MVMPLPVPAFSSLQLIDDVVAQRQNGINAAFFTGIHVEWRARVQAYLDAEGSPALVLPWPDIEARSGTFLNLYRAPAVGSAQSAVLAALRKHGLSLCPACGEAGAPNTLDHYLPKRRYPHFCITPHNLFPMCDACQSKKLEKTGDPVTPRFFVHPYYDVFVAEQVCLLKIVGPFDAPTFEFGPAPGLTNAQRGLITTHIRELEIRQRYGHFFKNEYRRLLRLTSKMRKTGQNVAETLNAFRIRVEEPSKNSWEHVFYAAVLGNADLLDYLQHEELPPYP